MLTLLLSEVFEVFWCERTKIGDNEPLNSQQFKPSLLPSTVCGPWTRALWLGYYPMECRRFFDSKMKDKWKTKANPTAFCTQAILRAIVSHAPLHQTVQAKTLRSVNLTKKSSITGEFKTKFSISKATHCARFRLLPSSAQQTVAPRLHFGEDQLVVKWRSKHGFILNSINVSKQGY